MANTALQTLNRAPLVQGDEVDSDQAYQGDIYGKGAFFMHTLRYVIGDERFFPALKKLATDPKYTYDNTVVTDDVQQVFTEAYGKSLQPLFDLFVYSTNKLEISLKKINATTWQAHLINLDMEIPVEVTTDTGLKKIALSKTPVKFESTTLPVIDEKVYYLKKVILEP
jgi:aminopeptidase N